MGTTGKHVGREQKLRGGRAKSPKLAQMDPRENQC